MNRRGRTCRPFLAAAFFLTLTAAATLLTPLSRAGGEGKGEEAARKVAAVEGVTEYRLPNGLRVLLFPDSSSAKLTVNCTVLVGSRHEGYGEAGMAHLLEHMLFKGCKLYPKPTDIPRALRDRGASFNATTSDDRTNYFETLNASEDNLDFALRLEADRLVNSFIRREDLASEMTVVRNEFEQGENNPQMILFQRMLAVAYEWHNYGKTTIGNRSDIERVPIERLQAFYHRHYRPDNVVLIVSGNFKEAKALERVTKYFGPLGNPSRPLEATYTEEPPQDGERSVVLRRVGAVGAVGAVYHIPAAAHPDCAPLDVLEHVLAAQPSGRLYRELVEKDKKLSSVLASAQGMHDPGAFIVFGVIDKNAPVEAARDALLAAIERARGDEIGEDEVKRAKDHFRTVWQQTVARSDRVASQLSEWAARGDWRLMFLHRDRVAQVKPDDVRRVLRTYLTATNRTVGLYVPTKEAERAAIPATPDLARMLQNYKGGEVVAAGEAFEPTVANIEKRLQTVRLDGGVRAALLPRKTRGGRVTIRLALHYGSAESLRGHTSATQFLAPMMLRGTEKHTRQQLVDEFNRLGARVNGGGLIGDATFTVDAKRDTLPQVLALLAEVLRQPAFPDNEFNVLKRQVREQLEESKTQPQMLALRALRRQMSSYSRDDVRYTPTVEESLERLEKVTAGEVRKLYAEQLNGQHGELVVIGDFDPEPVRRQFEEALKGWKAAVEYRRIERPMRGELRPARVVIETPDKESAIYFAATGMPLKDTDPDNAALVLANYLLGGGPLSSRLANRVRQKEGLAYSVFSHFTADAHDKSAMLMMFGSCNPGRIDELDRTVLDELNKMLKDGVTEAELREGKKAYLATLQQQRTDDAQLAQALLNQLHAGRSIGYYGELEKKIDALTVDEVNRVCRRHIDPKKLVVIRAGDFKKK